MGIRKRTAKGPGKQGRKAIHAGDVTLPAMPTEWDRGAMGRANRHGLVTEDRPVIDPDTGEARNPNGIRGVRRVDLLYHWHKADILSLAAYNVACKLRDAFEATQMGPGNDYSGDRVDSSPKPDHAVAIQTDRLSRFSAIYRHVFAGDRPIVECCVLHGQLPFMATLPNGTRPIKAHQISYGHAWLAAALDRLAGSVNGERSRPQPRFVYAVSSGLSGMIKFGMTSNRSRRIAALKHETQADLRFLGYFEVPTDWAARLEASILDAARATDAPTKGEWFFMTEEQARQMAVEVAARMAIPNIRVCGFGNDEQEHVGWSETPDEASRKRRYRRA